jgi:hypothetical protein
VPSKKILIKVCAEPTPLLVVRVEKTHWQSDLLRLRLDESLSMQITLLSWNAMDPFLRKLIFELLQFRRAEPSATEGFVKLKHNDDLCPIVQRKFDSIVADFDKYKKITYDIQGPRDRGTDVLIRQTLQEQNTFICAQIKSEDDFKSKSLLRDLKTQWFDTRAEYGNSLVEYFILLCCSTALKPKENPKPNKNKNVIRAIEGIFQHESQVTIIEPEYVWSFLGISERIIDAIVTAKFGSDDIVFKKALGIMAGLSSSERALAVYLIWRRIRANEVEISFEQLKNAGFLHNFYHADDSDRVEAEDEWPRLEKDERLIRDLTDLTDELVTQTPSGTYILEFDLVGSIAAIMLDAHIRYGYEDDELLHFTIDVFDL